MNKYSLQKIPTDYLREIADKHRALRKQKGLTQAELARRSGVSLGSLRRFERTGKIAFESLLQLAHLLDRLPDFNGLFQPVEDLSEIEALFSDKMRNGG